MEQIIKVDDSALLSKHIIRAKDIEALLPEEVKSQVKDVRVMVDNGRPRWMIFLKEGGAYHYEPLAKEMVFDVCSVKPAYGKIYLMRKGRYLRARDCEEPRGNKYYTVFLCRPKIMILWREVRELWYTQDRISGPGYSCYVKWFSHFNI